MLHTTSENRIKVWDIAVRLFHWSLLVFFVLSYISAEFSEEIHVITGYIVFGLVVFRLLWGVIGSHYARFSQFVYGPARVKRYLRQFMRARPEHYYGHNPAGGWAVVFMLTMLLLISYTGMKIEAVEGEGLLAQQSVSLVKTVYADNDEAEYEEEESADHEFWEDIHEVLVNIMLVFVVFHIVAVLVSSGMHEENLVKAMVTGYKKKVDDSLD